MGIRDAKREELERLECKTLDAQFRTVIQEGPELFAVRGRGGHRGGEGGLRTVSERVERIATAGNDAFGGRVLPPYRSQLTAL